LVKGTSHVRTLKHLQAAASTFKWMDFVADLAHYTPDQTNERQFSQPFQ